MNGEKWQHTGDLSRDMGNAVQDRLAGRINGEEYERRHKILDALIQISRGVKLTDKDQRHDDYEWSGV